MSIKKQALQKAIAMLQAAGAQYRIIDEDGQEYKNFEEKKTRNYKYPFGALTNYIRPYVEKMEVGELIEIPPDAYELNSIQSGVGGWFCNNHGIGSCMTSVNRDKNIVEVIRIA